MTVGTTASKQRWGVLGLVYVGQLAFAMVMQSIPPTLPLILRELGLSHTQGGLLMSFFALPGIVIAIPVGILADRYNQKAICLLAMTVMLTGTVVVASGNSLSVLLLGRVISGIGGATFVVTAPQLLAQRFAGREIGVAMGIFNTGMPLGTILSLNLLAILAQNQGWHAGLWLSAGIVMLALAAFAFWFKPAPKTGPTTPQSLGSLFKGITTVGRPIWFLGIIWGLFTATMISFFTFTPDLLTEGGLMMGRAGFITGLVMFPALLLSPVIGLVIDRYGYQRRIIIIGCIGITILMALVPGTIGWVVLLMLLIGIFQAVIPASVFSLAPEITSPEKLGLGYGIISVCMNIGILVGPTIAGFAKDFTASYQASYNVMAVFALLPVAVVILFLRRHHRVSPDNGTKEDSQL
ncbi:nitrate/nitrite transporter [Chloroflexota bacterium]